VCLIAVAIDMPGPWLLLMAANRDEFHDRHSAPAGYWERAAWDGNPSDGASAGILAGRDLQGGGTWLGVRRSPGNGSLRIGALTNLRSGLMPPSPATGDAVPPSRGRLVARYLADDLGPSRFLEALEPPPDSYAGFNLLAIRISGEAVGVDAGYLNNLQGSRPRRLEPGMHVVSNATLDVEWPKTRLLRAAMTEVLEAHGVRAARSTGASPGVAAAMDADPDADEKAEAFLLEALADRTIAPAAQLPATGLEPARESLLSAPFIVDDHYGTRCSTVIGVNRNGAVFFTERSYGPGGRRLGTVRERFTLAGRGDPRGG
jgi:uncharacterized protein with NRDE domain